MDGVLLIDKPSGPTSHDVVARLRRASGQRSIGHTGTLDPRATGLLVLVMGRATRLASLLTGGEKTYEATVRLGVATSTDDADGEPLGAAAATTPDAAAISSALSAFEGEIDQLPPRHSAKKIGGKKAYDLARRDQPVDLTPARVTVHELTITRVDGPRVDLVVRASAGFYVRALARDLGVALGCGGHLESLRRTRSGTFSLEEALPLSEAEQLAPEALERRLIGPADALPELEAVTLTDAGLRRAVHGNPLAPEHLRHHHLPPPSTGRPVRVLAADGQLVALAWSRGGALHPVAVLGYH